MLVMQLPRIQPTDTKIIAPVVCDQMSILCLLLGSILDTMMQIAPVHMWTTIDTSNSQILDGVQYKGAVAFLWSLFQTMTDVLLFRTCCYSIIFGDQLASILRIMNACNEIIMV